MGRLIDADKLIADMYHEAFEKDSDMQKWDSGCWIRYKMREELISHIMAICDLARLGAKVIKHNNCNNCKKKDCEYRPEWGDSVRWNCPLWEGGDGE